MLVWWRPHQKSRHHHFYIFKWKLNAKIGIPTKTVTDIPIAASVTHLSQFDFRYNEIALHLTWWTVGAADRWCLDAVDLSLNSWPRQWLCPSVISLKSLKLTPSLPVHWANWIDFSSNFSSVEWIQNGFPLIHGCGLAFFHRCTAHAQLATYLPLLHHRASTTSSTLASISLSGQINFYCGRKCR